MIEVLVTIVIIAFGLLGLAGLQSRLQVSEIEAYQRAQALILLNDMASRIGANRRHAAEYVTSTPVGAGGNCVDLPGGTRQQLDVREWCLALQGAAEALGGNRVGAMVGGRGCVESVSADEYLVTVAWQGLTPIAAPPSGVSCGQNSYDNAGGACTNDRCRRAVTTVVRLGALD